MTNFILSLARTVSIHVWWTSSRYLSIQIVLPLKLFLGDSRKDCSLLNFRWWNYQEKNIGKAFWSKVDLESLWLWRMLFIFRVLFRLIILIFHPYKFDIWNIGGKTIWNYWICQCFKDIPLLCPHSTLITHYHRWLKHKYNENAECIIKLDLTQP